MDGSHFDTLSRAFSTAGSRRRALSGFLLGALGLLSRTEAEDAIAHDLKATCKKKSGAAKKTCLKKARKHKAQHAREALGCPVEQVCAGTCCPVGQVCKDGTACCTEDRAAFCTPPGTIRCGSLLGPCGRPIDCGSCPVGTGIELCINGVCQD